LLCAAADPTDHGINRAAKTNRITGPWCGSALHYLEAIGAPRYEDFVIKYRDNVYVGNGKSEVEGRSGDMSWYIGGRTHPFRSDLFRPMKAYPVGALTTLRFS
jgi:hypothetical protein